MRVVYVVPSSAIANDGVRRRVDMTLRAWRTLGADAVLVTGGRPPAVSGVGSVIARGRWELRDDTDLRKDAIRAARAPGTVVHVRYYSPGPGWRGVADRVPLTVEVHARLLRPERALDAPRIACNAALWPLLSSRVGGAAFVTEELADSAGFRGLTPRVIIGNGVLLSPEPVPPPRPGGRPRVVMAVGSDASWHGLDLLAQLARCGDLDVRVVCPHAVVARVQAQVIGSGVRVVPTWSRDDYRRALAEADVAVGTLALGRKGLNEAAPLKVRDYVDLGIPAVLPYTDTNLADITDDPALLHLSWSAEFPMRLGEWAATMTGRRLKPSTRDAVDIFRIEQRRLALLSHARVGDGTSAPGGLRDEP